MSNFRASDLCAHNIRSDEVISTITSIIQSINKNIYNHKPKYGQNVYEYHIPIFSSIIEASAEVKAYILGSICKNFIERGFTVNYVAEIKKMYIMWESTFDKDEYDKAFIILQKCSVSPDKMKSILDGK